MNTPAPSCLIAASDICAKVVIDFPVWEVLATLVLTAAVTAVTILASVRAARRETMKSIRVSLETENRERRERRDAHAAETKRNEHRQRTALAEALARSAHELQALQDLGTKDPSRLAAESAWRSLRVTFRATGLEAAIELYAYADFQITRGMIPKPQWTNAKEYAEKLIRRNFATSIEEAAVHWISAGRIPDRVLSELKKFREEQAEADAKNRAEMRRFISGLSGRTPASRKDADAGSSS